MAVIVHESVESATSARSFRLGTSPIGSGYEAYYGHYVSAVDLYLRKYSTSITGTLYVRLYRCDPVTRLPITQIAQDTIAANSISQTAQWYSFDFGGSFWFDAGEVIGIVVYCSGGDGSHFLQWYYYSNYSDYMFGWGNGLGSISTVYDSMVKIYGEQPSASLGSTSSITATTVDCEFTIDDVTDLDDYGFEAREYGSESYDVSTTFGVAPSVGLNTNTLTGLNPATHYYFRAKVHHTSLGWIYIGYADGYTAARDVYFQSAHDDTLIPWASQTSPGTGTGVDTFKLDDYIGVVFTAVGQQLKSLKVYLTRDPSLGEMYIEVFDVDAGTGKPTGSALVSKHIPSSWIPAIPTYTWFEFGLGDGITLVGGQKYAIICRAIGGDGNNWCGWLYGYNGGGDDIYGLYSGDYGSTWTIRTAYDFYFYEYGESGIETHPATDIEAIRATGNGFTYNTDNVTQMGFEWGKVSGVYTDENVDTSGVYEPGVFGLDMTGLDPSTVYYYRAKLYHTTYGWLYGPEVSFTTLDPKPIVETNPPTTVGDDYFIGAAEITYIGPDNVDERGFVASLTSHSDPGDTDPDDSDYEENNTETGDWGVGSYTLQVGNLQTGRVYYIRAVAHNDYGWAYGRELRVLISPSVNILYPTGDASIGIRFNTLPGEYYPKPHPHGSSPHPYSHYPLVQTRNTSFTSGGYFGYISGKFVYERIYYNTNQYTDLYTMSNPTKRDEGVVKVKWIAALYKNEYPYGSYYRKLVVGGTTYTGAEHQPPNGDVCEIFYTSPKTGLAWTIAELDAIQAGASIGDAASYGTVALDFVSLVVCWANASAVMLPTTNFDGSSATLNGRLTEDEAGTCQVRFNYGPDTGYGTNTDWQTVVKGQEFSADIEGLDPEVDYHVRVEILTGCGETFYSTDDVVQEEQGTLILEQAYSVAAVRQPIFTSAPTWTDITEYCMGLKTKRGRMHEFDKVEAGTMVVTLNNAAGHFWRNNTAGDYYPDIQPLTLTRLRYKWKGTTYPIWYGVSERYLPGWLADNEGGATPIMTMECVDYFKSFNRYKLTAADIKLTEKASPGDSHVHLENVDFLHEGQSISLYQDDVSETLIINQITPSLNLVIFTTNVVNTYSSKAHIRKFPAVLSGQRIKDCLLEMDFPTALMDIDDGEHYVIAHTPKDEGTNILEHMYAVAEAEDGILFVARDGLVTFQDSQARTRSPYNTSQATFNDDGTAQMYAHPQLVDDDTFIYNEADILGPGIAPQQVVVGDAADEQGPRALVRKESQLYFSTDAFVQAFTLAKRFQQSILRPEQLLVLPQADPDNLYPIIFGYDISTRITLNLDTTTNPAEISRDYHIEGVEHEWTAKENLWKTWWQLWSVNRYRAFACTHDGYFRNYSDGGTYLEMHDDTDANYVENDGTKHNPYTDADEIVVGQQLYFSFLGFNGSLWRGFLEFDTSELLSTDTPIAAFILLHIKESFIDDRAWNIVATDPDTAVNPLVVSDYGVIGAQDTQQGAAVMLRQDLWVVIPLNANGLNLLVAEGTTRFGLRSNWDIAASDNDEAAGYTDEYGRFHNINTNYPPRLVIQLEE